MFGPATPPPEVNVTTFAYGTARTSEALDLYLPAGRRGEPLAVFVHGGAWVSGDKRDYAELGATFAKRGIAAAIVNYPLAPTASAQEQAGTVGDAVHWLVARAGAAGYDGARVFLIGHSAGAQLVLFALLSGLVPRAPIAGIVAIGAVGINPSRDVQELQQQYQGIYDPAFGPDRETWSRFDIGPRLLGKEPPCLVIHGRADDMAPEAISRELVEQLRAAGDRVDYLQPEGRDHWGILLAMAAQPDDPTMLAVERFILRK